MSDNLLALVYKIVQEECPPIPNYFSSDLSSLVKSMLQKNDEKRPTVSDLLSLPFMRRYMEEFIESMSIPIIR